MTTLNNFNVSKKHGLDFIITANKPKPLTPKDLQELRERCENNFKETAVRKLIKMY